MRLPAVNRFKAITLSITLLTASSFAQQQPQMTKIERGRALDMLQVVANDVKKHYYDPKFHGVDFDAKVTLAKQQIQASNSFNMAMSHIAAMLDTLNDSHTFFVPPQHAYRHDYGFTYQMIGEHCFVTHVRPGSDAEKKGLKPGDQILTINGYNVTRDDSWKIEYVFNLLRPQPGLHLQIADSPGTPRQFDVLANIHPTNRISTIPFDIGVGIAPLLGLSGTDNDLFRPRYYEVKDQLIVLKMPVFAFTPEQAHDILVKLGRYPRAIVDLRGNSAGSFETLRDLVGGMFDRDTKIADRVGRKETKTEVAKGAHRAFGGKLIVLVDSNTAAESELFARVMQIEKRGTIMGDRTSGSVMEAKQFDERIGAEIAVFYNVCVTEWDLIMSDGKSLEHTGVTPDEIVLPDGNALAAGKDPVLAKAAEMLGVKLSSEDAGKAFPYEWAPE